MAAMQYPTTVRKFDGNMESGLLPECQVRSPQCGVRTEEVLLPDSGALESGGGIADFRM